MNTPKSKVHWALDSSPSLSEFGSPFSDTSIVDTTSSLQYINSQLVAHGFTSSPGLSLDGVSPAESEKVIKCLLGMLAQRVQDMSRTEELSTKLRTLSYDHERLTSFHRTAVEKAANAEREMTLHKSRLTAITRTLQSSETAHKHTTAELQRTRTSLQAIRATHQSELRKKEKETERMVEKWSKLSDGQVKIGLANAASGLTMTSKCANVAVVDGSEVLGKGQGFLETALEQAEDARSRFAADNGRLRRLVLTAVNEVQALVHSVRQKRLQQSPTDGEEDEPTPITFTALFPLASSDTASDKLSSVLSSLRETLDTLSLNPFPPAGNSKPSPGQIDLEAEIGRLQGVIETLRTEIDDTRKASAESAAETQALFDQFAKDPRIINIDSGDVSIELMSVPLRDAERERLDSIKAQLDEERKKFTEAAVRLGKERAGLEAERIKFLDEQRSWQVQLMLAELPPTPIPSSSSSSSSVHLSPVRNKSPRKASSPRKKSPVKATTVGSGRKIRVSRRSSASSSSSGLASPPRKALFPLAYETEVAVLPQSLIPSTTSVAMKPSASSFLPTSFVLPPPSPHSSMPAQPLSAPSTSIAPSQHQSSSRTPLSSTTPLASPPSTADIPPSAPAPAPAPVPPPPITPPGLGHGSRRPFPLAKPFAPRIVHAYSPVKPSPLSRILKLADSPASPLDNSDEGESEGEGLGVVMEEDEDEGAELFPALPPAMSLEEELGLTVTIAEENAKPLGEKKVAITTTNAVAKPKRGRVFYPEPKKFTTKEKGKGRDKAEASNNKSAGILNASASARTARSAATPFAFVEKENDKAVSIFSTKPPPPKVTNPSSSSVNGISNPKKAVIPRQKPLAAGASTSRARLMAKLPPPTAKGGARRVLIDSAEAPQLGKGWRG